MNSDLQKSKLYQALAWARDDLKTVELRHERMVNEAAPDLRDLGRDYAAATRKYADAVMAWLSWLERQGDTTRAVSAEPAARRSTSAGKG